MFSTEDEQTTVAVVTIGDVLRLVPPEKRLDVLKQATVNEEAKTRERQENGGLLRSRSAAEIADGFSTSPEMRCWNHIMRFKSLVVQVFVRDITNNHSRDDAAKVLFMEHRGGTGSGWLPDYLANLPAVTINRKEAAAMAEAQGRTTSAVD